MDDDDEEENDEKTVKGQLPESVKSTQSKPNHGLQQIKYMTDNKGKGKHYQDQGNKNKHWEHRRGFGALEDDDDDIEPEWNSFDPDKETGSFFGRVIENEDQFRNKFTKKPVLSKVDEIEDAFDELVFEELEMDEDYQKQKAQQ